METCPTLGANGLDGQGGKWLFREAIERRFNLSLHSTATLSTRLGVGVEFSSGTYAHEKLHSGIKASEQDCRPHPMPPPSPASLKDISFGWCRRMDSWEIG
jgi:hypothetical protein